MTISETVIAVIKKKIGDDADFLTTDSFSDLGLDSLDQIEILMDVEHNIDVTVPDENFEHLDTPAKLISYLERITTN